MTSSIELKTRLIQEFKFAKHLEVHLVVSIDELLKANTALESTYAWKIPLDANVRRPTKNSVVTSIVETLKNQPKTVISSPIHISADFEILPNSSIKLYFKKRGNFSDGILDGGHRLLAFVLAAIHKVPLTQAFVNITVYSGLSGEQLRRKAIALNTSKTVSSMSLANYRGDFDWMKDILRDYRIAYCQGQFGKYVNSVEGCCTIERVCKLILLLDPTYDPRDLQSNKEHPIYVTGGLFKRKDFHNKIRDLFPLVHDALEIQTSIYLLFDEKHKKNGASLITKDLKDSRHATRLPTGEILSFNIASHSIIFPMLSAFRSVVKQKENSELLYIDLKEDQKIKIIKKMFSRIIDILKQDRNRGRTLSKISEDPYLWQEMYAIVLNHVENS